MKKVFIFISLSFIVITGFSQNFDPAGSIQQQKIEKLLKNKNSIERVYLSDTAKHIFTANAGEEYFTAFLYEKSDKTTRRMRLIELGPNGETVSIKYPKVTKAVKDDVMQLFGISVTPDAKNGPTTQYQIDANPASTVLIYKLIKANIKD